MIVEHAELAIEAGREVAFEAAFTQAREVISQAGGFHWVELLRGVERPGVYLLLVGWDSVEAHNVGFRGSAAFARWRELIGPYFASPPAVEHFGVLGERFAG